MAKITLPYTIQNGNTADGGQVQQDFDAILAQVNGNLDADNIASGAVNTTQLVDGAVTAAKIASTVGLIDDFAYGYVSSSISIPASTETNLITLDVTAAGSEYIIVLAEANFLFNNSTTFQFKIYVDSTLEHEAFSATSASGYEHELVFYADDISAGSHTINIKVESGIAGNVSGLNAPYARAMALLFRKNS